MSDYATFTFPLDLLSTLAGGVVGFVLVFIVDWVKRPRVKLLGFAVSTNFGTLYKLRFRLRGCTEPPSSGAVSLSLPSGTKLQIPWRATTCQNSSLNWCQQLTINRHFSIMSMLFHW